MKGGATTSTTSTTSTTGKVLFDRKAWSMTVPVKKTVSVEKTCARDALVEPFATCKSDCPGGEINPSLRQSYFC